MSLERYFCSSFSALSAVTGGLTYARDTIRLSGTHFAMEVPKDWQPGYEDLAENLFMIYFKDIRSGAILEGVFFRKVQPVTYTLADFKKWRKEVEGKRYDGRNHRVVKDGAIAICGESGNYLLTHWRDGDKEFEKHTAQYLKQGRQYMVVLHGQKGKVDKRVFDHAVSSFAPGKE